MKVKLIYPNEGSEFTFDCNKYRMSIKEVLESFTGYRVISIIDDNNREIIIGEPK